MIPEVILSEGRYIINIFRVVCIVAHSSFYEAHFIRHDFKNTSNSDIWLITVNLK
jgi:hypothetical protein